MTAHKTANLPASAADHLADARLHLTRCLLALKAAATADPSLLVKLGSRHAALVEELRQLEQVR